MKKPKPIAREEWDFDEIEPDLIGYATTWEYLRECPRWVNFFAAIQNTQIDNHPIQWHFKKRKFFWSQPKQVQDRLISELLSPPILPVAVEKLVTQTTFLRDYPGNSHSIEIFAQEPGRELFPACNFVNDLREWEDDRPDLPCEQEELDSWKRNKPRLIAIDWNRPQKQIYADFAKLIANTAIFEKHPTKPKGRTAHKVNTTPLKMLGAWRFKRAGYGCGRANIFFKETIKGEGHTWPEYEHTEQWSAAHAEAENRRDTLNRQAPDEYSTFLINSYLEAKKREEEIRLAPAIKRAMEIQQSEPFKTIVENVQKLHLTHKEIDFFLEALTPIVEHDKGMEVLKAFQALEVIFKK
jgi:hypothetical protein